MSEQDWVTTSAGIFMPRIIYGTAWKKERTAELVEKYLHAGFRGFDTACQPKHYNEKLVGVGLQCMREEGVTRESLYLQTKFTPLSSQDLQQLPYTRTATLAEQVAQSFEVSQANLQTDYVDSLLLHSPLESHAQTMQAWSALEKIVKDGGARQLGISNCYDINIIKALYADASVKPAIVQNRLCKENGYQIEVREWCAQNSLIFQSFWSLTANGDIVGSEIVRILAVKYNKTPAQIFFRYLSQSGIVPLSGTTSDQHMQEDLDIFEFELCSEDVNNVNLLLNTV